MTSMLIIDGNNWFRRRAETDIMGNPLRRCYYEIQSAPYDVIILVWDGFNSAAKRRALYPDYKRNRKPAGEDIYEFQKLFKKVAEFSRAVIIEIPETEADDIIARLVKEYRDTVSIKIESNDADFAQLGVPLSRDEFKIPPRWVALYKTLVGDPSDNIKGIKGFGQKAWESLTEDDKLGIELCLQDDSPGRAQGLEFGPDLKYKVEFENLNILRTYWKIVNFMLVEGDLPMLTGKDDENEAEKIFKQYLS